MRLQQFMYDIHGFNSPPICTNESMHKSNYLNTHSLYLNEQ